MKRNLKKGRWETVRFTASQVDEIIAQRTNLIMQDFNIAIIGISMLMFTTGIIIGHYLI